MNQGEFFLLSHHLRSQPCLVIYLIKKTKTQLIRVHNQTNQNKNSIHKLLMSNNKKNKHKKIKIMINKKIKIKRKKLKHYKLKIHW